MRLSSVRSGLVLPLLALLALPVALSAQEMQLFTWTGRVDREVDITMRGRNVAVNTNRNEEYRGRFNIGGALPHEDGIVRVIVSGGRGEVSVVQQPNASNNYSATIRMVDRSSGADRYQVTAYFTPSNVGTTGRYDNGRGNNGGYNNGNGGYNNGRRGRMQPVVLHWAGMVDANAEVRWSNGRVRNRALDGNTLRRVQSSITGNMNNGMMNRGNQVVINKTEGRGDVEITQQPSASNGWTTIIHINDPQGGYGRYAFDVVWQ
jgi:hypothetical protein